MNNNNENRKQKFDIPNYPTQYNCEPVDESPAQTLAIIAFGCAVASILLCQAFIGIPFAIVALILGIVSVHKHETKFFSVAAIITGAISLIISAVWFVVKFDFVLDYINEIMSEV